MANIDHSKQENYSSKAARNIGAIQRPFSGTNTSSPGHNAQGFIRGSSDALNRPRVVADGDGVFHTGALVPSRSTGQSYGTSGIISPMQRSQELSAQRSGSPVLINVQRKDNFADTVGLSNKEKGTILRQRRDAFVQEYHDLTDPTTAKLVGLCGEILNVDVNIEQKYAELDIRRVLEANQEKTHFLHLTQGLGILEKYASNLIKESRPPYWRTVKFTSTLIQVHVAQLIGSRDILSQIGYTQDIADGVAFPASVTEPDVNRLKNLAPDLFFARYEIDALIGDAHPFYELKPKIPQGEIQSPALMRRDVPPSRPQRFPPSQQSALPQAAVVTFLRVPAMLTSTFPTARRSQSPIPAVRRNRGRDPLSSSAEKELKTSSHTNQEPQASTDKNSDSEEESEYEDAEDGIKSLSFNDSECRVCGESTAGKFCKDCKDTFCRNCDEVYHKHPSRQHHVRTEFLLTSPAKPLGYAEQPVTSATAPTRSSEMRKQCGPVVSPVTTVTNTNTESRPRPVPAPRRNKAPLPPNQSVTQNSATTEPQKGIQSVSHKPQEESRISQPTNVSHPADTIMYPPLLHGSQSIAPTTTSRAQTRQSERQILRPPPFPQAALNTVDEGANKQVDKGTPASTLPLKPKVPVESKAVREEVAKSSALSCPICFCLNAGDAKTCIFCKNPLPATTQSSDQSLSRLPTPKLPSSQHQVQQSKGNASIVSSSAEAVDPDKWECEHCTFHNPRTRRICEVCCKTSSNIPLPVRSAEIPGPQRNSQNVTNMVMQSNVQPMRGIADPLKRVEPQKVQASQDEIALPTTKKGLEISEQSGIENASQKFPSTTTMPEMEAKNQVIRDSGVVLSRQKFPMPQLPGQDGVSVPPPAMQGVFPVPAPTIQGGFPVPPPTKQGGFPVPQPTNQGGFPAPPPTIQGGFPAPPATIQGGFPAPPPTIQGGFPAPPPTIQGGFPAPPPTIQGGFPAPPPTIQGGFPAPPPTIQGGFPAPPPTIQGGFPAPPPMQGGFPVPQPKMQGGFPMPPPTLQAGFPVPPPSMRTRFPLPSPEVQPGGTVGSEPPVPGPASPPLQQQGFSSAFSQPSPNLATIWSSSFPDESVRRQQEEILIAGSHYVKWLRKAEKDGFSAEELNIACVLAIDDLEGPIHWLHTSWYDLIHKVMLEVAIPENSQEIGNISPEEAKEALIECTGEVSRATAKCMEIRKKKVKELQKAGVYAKTDCILALDGSKGDTEKAINSLERTAMRPMLQRVLNSCLPNHATEDDVFQVLARQIDTQSPQDKANFEAIVKDKAQNLDRRIRAILVEANVPSWGRAETAIKLIDQDFSVDDSIEAAISGGDLKQALRYLKQECPVCYGQKPMGQMVTFLHCQDRVCRECVKNFVTITIKDKNILHLVCPVCGKPENLEDEAVANEYFNNFDIMIRGIVDQETHDLFQRKLRDRTLMKEPSFRWCSHCSSGFINEQPGQLKMMCPHCRQHTCFKCKRQWEDQHEGITCEQFEAWKAANDPEFQAAGLAAHLKMNGIVCPRCKFRYDLAKGGCMHFKCAMCPHEFCSGCYKPFINNRNEQCGVSEECQLRGLHAHHPRDCYFYLRDRSTQELQKLLDDNDIAYDTEPPEGQENTSSGEEDAGGAAAAEAPLRCKVSEQKESENGLQDAECGDEVPPGHAGLCGKHYKEYLVVLVNDNLLDPADIMSCDDLKCVLRRGFVPIPAPRNRMTEEQYRQILLQTVKDHLPLPDKPPRKRILDENDVALPNIEDDAEDVDNDFLDNDSDDGWEEDFRFDQRDEQSY